MCVLVSGEEQILGRQNSWGGGGGGREGLPPKKDHSKTVMQRFLIATFRPEMFLECIVSQVKCFLSINSNSLFINFLSKKFSILTWDLIFPKIALPSPSTILL